MRAKPKPLTSEQQALAEAHMGLVESVARYHKAARGLEWSEAIAAGYLGLVEAARNYKPGGSAPFPAFARYRIRGELTEAARVHGEAKKSRPVPVREQLSSASRGKVINVTPDPPVGQEIEAIDEIDRISRKVPAKHGQAIRLMFIGGMNQYRAAKCMGINESRVSQLQKQAFEMLRNSVPAGSRTSL